MGGGGVLAGESIVWCVSYHNKHFLQVCIADFNAQVGDETAKELSNKYCEGKVLFTKCDVTSQKDMEGKQAQTHMYAHARTHTRTQSRNALTMLAASTHLHTHILTDFNYAAPTSLYIISSKRQLNVNFFCFAR